MSKKSNDRDAADPRGTRGAKDRQERGQVRPGAHEVNVDAGGEPAQAGRNSARESAETRRTEQQYG